MLSEQIQTINSKSKRMLRDQRPARDSYSQS
jgi:hypothetical protein